MRKKIAYVVGAGATVLAVASGLVVALTSGAQASTTVVTATELATAKGRTGSGQPVSNLAKADLSGKRDGWDRYVEFIGEYSGYLTFAAPPNLSPGDLTGVEVRLNYRGPAPRTQTWTFLLFDWTKRAWVSAGTNAGVHDWGPWAPLTFAPPRPHARYVSSNGALRLGIAANNSRDAADIDYAALALTSTGGSDPTPPAERPSATTVAPAALLPTALPPITGVPATSAVHTSRTSSPTPTRTRTSTANPKGPVPCPGCWRPALRTSWNWVLAKVPTAPFRNVDMYDIDGFDASAANVAALHNAGIRVVCYISAGSYESWRPDADQFPTNVLGRNLDGWPGERWLDVRDLRDPGGALARIMTARIDMCRAKGFDAVEFDNMDGHTNQTGFPLSGADQLAYNRFLANTAHARGLSAVMKNDVDQLDDLVDYFDMALNEQCNQYYECGGYRAFTAAGKPVFNAEYGSSTAFCAADNAANINGVRFSLDLDDSVYRPCG